MRRKPKQSKTPRTKRTPRVVTPMRAGLAWSLCGLATTGVLISLYLTYIHYRLRREPGWSSVCALTDSMNCDTALLSPYGALAGLPLPLLAIWFYGGAALLACLDLRHDRPVLPRSPAAVLFVLSGIATVFSLSLAAVSLVSLRLVCILCAALYLVNGLMLIVSWRAVYSTGESLRSALGAECARWDEHLLKAVGYITAAFVLLWAAQFAYVNGSPGGSVVCEAVAAAKAASASPEDLAIVFYGDFQCAHCQAAYLQLRLLRHNDRLRIEFRHFPIDATCNPAVKESHFPGACDQARAAICAEEQGAGERFRDRLFDEGAGTVTVPDLLDLATSLGLERGAMEACLQSHKTTAELAEDIRAARTAGVHGTPALIINSRLHMGRLSRYDLQCLGDERFQR